MARLKRREEGEVVIERGVPWSRDRAGRIHWWYDDAAEWVAWRSGADAPPLPPGWEPRATRTRTRRLLLRLVPLGVAVAIVILAVHAASPSKKVATNVTQLVGKCVHLTTVKGQPTRATIKQVGCGSAQADLKVTKIVAVDANGHPIGCPAGTTGTIVLPAAGVTHPPVECVVKVSR
jgi:hypothetical protein